MLYFKNQESLSQEKENTLIEQIQTVLGEFDLELDFLGTRPKRR